MPSSLTLSKAELLEWINASLIYKCDPRYNSFSLMKDDYNPNGLVQMTITYSNEENRKKNDDRAGKPIQTPLSPLFLAVVKV